MAVCIVSPVYAKSGTCETLITTGWRFGCDSKDQSADKEYGYGTYVQIIGKSECMGVDNTKFNPLWNNYFKCIDLSGTSDDEWQSHGTNFCNNTSIRKADALVDNAIYQIFVGNSLKDTFSAAQLKSTSTGWMNGCLRITCADGYVAEDDACVELAESSIACTANSKNHGSSSDTNKLTMVNGALLYCYSSGAIAGGLAPSNFENTCYKDHKVFKNNNTNVYYRCADVGEWKEERIAKCAKSPFEKCDGIDNCVINLYADNEIMDIQINKNELFSANEVCFKAECKNGYQKQGGTCVANSAVAAQAQAQKDEQARQTAQAEAQAQQDELARQEALKAANEAVYNEMISCLDSYGNWDYDNNSCTCNKTEKYMTYNTALKKCECLSGDYILDKGSKGCILSEAKRLERICNGVTDASWINGQCICTDLQYVFDGKECVVNQEIIKERERPESSKKIKEAGKKLDDIVAGFGEANEWTNAEGKFNTARLASDSIAGVVLGSAGGLITSNVMKKKQVEQGFEDLKCFVGGQAVAGWGDEFNVGIQ